MSDSHSRWWSPTFLAKLVLWYAAIHIISGIGIVVLFPSPTFVDTFVRLREVAASSVGLVALGALVLVLDEYVTIFWRHIVPLLQGRATPSSRA